jgi:hypothetical protein
MGGMVTTKRFALAMSAAVAILAVVAAYKWSVYDPTPAIWHEVSIERGVSSDRDIDVTVERGWTTEVGERIVRDLWVKYGGSVRVEFRCATGGPAMGYLGVGIRSATMGPAVVANPDGSCS